MIVRYTFLDLARLSDNVLLASELLASAALLIITGISLGRCRRPGVLRYYRDLPVYFIISGVTELIANLVPVRALSIYIYWAFILFETMYFLHFFSRWLNRFVKGYQYGGTTLVTGISMLIYFRSFSPRPAAFTAATVESLVMVVPCIYYFIDVFQRPTACPLQDDPTFWTVTGIFAYFSMNLPILWFSNYFDHTNRQYLAQAIYSIHNFVLVITYSLFTKAMTCLKNNFSS